MSEIDEGLYSRQLYVLGKNAMKKLCDGDVLICGMGGPGIEVAKNLALAGVGKIVIHDLKELTWKDLSSQFLAEESDIGKNRAVVSRQKLSELNPHVNVLAHVEVLNDDFIKSFTAVVLTDSCSMECQRIDQLCRNSGIPLVMANAKGVFGQVFCDFGENFTITDKYSSEPNQFEILNILKKNGTLEVNVSLDSRGSLAADEFVTFHGVQGLTEIPERLLALMPCDDSVGYQGYVTEIRLPESITFKSYEESLQCPNYVASDYSKIDDQLLVHRAFLTLDDYFDEHNRLPRPKSEQDAHEFIEMYQNKNLLHGESELTNEKKLLLRKFSMTCDGDLSPLHSVIGSLAAQEVVKALTGKFQPLQQWFQFDARELLDAKWIELTEDDFSPRGDRYDGIRGIIGEKVLQRLANSKLFLVGVGAVGCEMLKNWSMLGLGAGDGGLVSVTDMDMIERSNLNRQFLFRNEHIGKMKSTVAAGVIKRMNSQINIESHVSKVAKETEDLFTDSFFQKLDVVISALDNIEARNYIDERCIYQEKPLIDCGTEGLQCNTQVILPHRTVSYQSRSTSNQNEVSIPMCTLKFFPSRIEHTIQWARDDFEGKFCLSIKAAKEYMEEADFWKNFESLSPYQKLKDIRAVFNDVLNSSEPIEENLIKWARKSFEEHFNYRILEILLSFPPKYVTSKGLPFWHGSKRCPSVITFDANNSLHMDYIVSTVNLLAQVFSLPLVTDGRGIDFIRNVLNNMHVPKFEPDTNLKIPTEDEDLKSQIENVKLDDEELHEILKSLPPRESSLKLKMNALQFDKDCDSHVEYITAASNLRATNYNIPAADKLQTKKIVGKIIPAVTTTTSFVVGLACIELIKILKGDWTLDNFRNSYNTLSSCNINCTKLREPPTHMYNDDGKFTMWSRFDIDHDITIGNLIDYFKDMHMLAIDHIAYGDSILLSTVFTHNVEERKTKTISQAVAEVTKKELKPHVTSLKINISGEDKNGSDLEELPFVKIKIC
ncbi:hypothetical protein HELRODRAFT_156323 [Helobdella robusta]|uniref:Ubiquitin-activating enzyme E1 C-terminal domain-containing protein n=1 Tax=Helobdella robusta TaxID=6412 RepID=T1ELT8_HELRO|nr:hypothetical protein HELRODRAFT_156323 [Helobdella robusta]ESO10929.1 hypothetical protein HELRODRAFT_156323 [Helobdella robusta]